VARPEGRGARGGGRRRRSTTTPERRRRPSAGDSGRWVAPGSHRPDTNQARPLVAAPRIRPFRRVKGTARYDQRKEPLLAVHLRRFRFRNSARGVAHSDNAGRFQRLLALWGPDDQQEEADPHFEGHVKVRGLGRQAEFTPPWSTRQEPARGAAGAASPSATPPR